MKRTSKKKSNTKAYTHKKNLVQAQSSVAFRYGSKCLARGKSIDVISAFVCVVSSFGGPNAIVIFGRKKKNV